MTTNPRSAEPMPPLMARFHFIGIGGIGMSALARILKMRGYEVSGSDIAESSQTASLRTMGIPVVIGHDSPELASKADILVTNRRALGNARIEIDAAVANGAQVIRRAELLGMAAQDQFSLAVAGSHGKSTTSGMLSMALRTLEADPTFAIGAILASTGTNAEPGEGKHFVVEADEFDRSFHGLFPNVAIITSVSFDHPDIYTNDDEYNEAFVQFIGNMQPNGVLVISGDDVGAHQVLGALPRLQRSDIVIQTFGETVDCDWQLSGDATDRVLTDPQNVPHQLRLRIPGKHNARNATAAIAALHAAGFSLMDAIRGVESFTGIGRRFEFKGTVAGADVIDDYAHHPDEIAAVLDAAREHYPGKHLIVVHQPHTYSRTWSLMNEFAHALDGADTVILMDIYGVGEVNEHNISIDDLGQKMTSEPLYAGTAEQAAEIVHKVLAEHSAAVVLTLGAGTITRVGPLLVTS